MEWPFTTKARMRSETLTSVQALEQRLDNEHRAKVLALDEQHAATFAEFTTAHHDQRKADALRSVVAVVQQVASERRALIQFVEQQPASQRVNVLKERIAQAVRECAPPIIRHPLLSDEENPTVPKPPNTTAAADASSTTNARTATLAPAA